MPISADNLTMTEIELIQFVGWKMFYAVVCGSIVGFERKINDSSAGFKTQILVCVGSMLFTVVPFLIPGLTTNTESARIIAQIISGVGFLGAGAIIHNGSNHVTGLTTAAWIWFTAAIGVIIGLEHGLSAIFITGSLTLVITMTRKIEKKFFGRNSLLEEDALQRRRLQKAEKKQKHVS